MTNVQQVESGSTSSFAQLFEASQENAQEHELGGEGQIVTGVVIRVNRDFVIVDILLINLFADDEESHIIFLLYHDLHLV